MRLNVNPNRMELSKMKSRLATATRGHKLLKDKQDEMMRQFIEMVKHNNNLRKQVEAKLLQCYGNFVVASAETSPEFIEEALMMPTANISLNITKGNIMGVKVPKMSFEREKGEGDNIYPYGFFNTSGQLDHAIAALNEVLPLLLQLGEVEKTCNMLADEIEKTRRRVNALEYMTIPQLEETIKYIRMKLEEDARSSTVRLMKVKSMMAAQN